MNEEISRIDINNVNYKLKDEDTRALGEMGKQALIKVGYYVCSTPGSTAAKTINATDYTLSTGGCIKVKMDNANTVNDATLNINSTGAKPLYYAGERASANNSWDAGETVEVYYDGTNFYANNVAGGSGSGDGAFDVSAKYPTSGVEGGNTYTLAGALTVLNANLSAKEKKGGMSIKFVQSSDNKYVQYRLMSDTFNTIVTNWVSVEKITEPLFNALGYEQIIYATNDFEVTGTRYLLVVLQNYPTLVGIGNTVEVVFRADVDCVIIPYAYGNAASIYHTYPQITLTANVPSTVIMSIDESQTYYAFGGLATTAGNYSIKVTNYDFEKIKELNKIEADLIYDWILSESYTVVSASYTDGEINSPVSVKWPDGETGTLTLTKNADGLITMVDASYKSSTYRLAITRNSEGNTTATSIVKL